MYKKLILAITIVGACLSIALPVQAKSQCSGLSNSACASNKTCTWRKSSVDKNGKKTKAHCRALPGKAKSITSSTNKAKSSSKSSTKSATTKSVKNKSSKDATKAKDKKKKDKKKKDKNQKANKTSKS